MGHSRHHHHHHHRKGGDDNNNITSIIGDYLAKGEDSGRSDSTSQFRDTMRRRRLRKMIVTRILWTLGWLIAILVMCAVVYAYIIDR